MEFLVKDEHSSPDALDETPQLAVVVIALGAPVETIDAVRSVLEQEPTVEVVVVNSGGGGMAQLLARHEIDIPAIEHEEKLYAGAARNIGIRATHAPYVAFLASDCSAAPGWAQRRIKAHRAGAAAVGSAVVNANPHNPFAWASHLSNWSRRMPGARRGLAYGASYDRRLFEVCGYFREDLRVGEDTEFHERLLKNDRPKWKRGKIHTIHRNPTGFLHLITDQFQRGARRASHEYEFRGRLLDFTFRGWWSRTNHSLRASRNVNWRYRTAVWLARPLIPVAMAAYCMGGRSWLRQHQASAKLADVPTAREVNLNIPRVEPVIPSYAVLTKELFGSNWSARRLLRRPRIIAIFSFRYDADLVPDLIENLRPIVDGYVAYDDRGASEPYTDERARKAALRKEARDMGAQWLLCIDPDERLEIAAAGRIKAMTAVIEPIIWTFRLREMYTPHSYRVDGHWKKKRLGCLFPSIAGQIFSNAPLHGLRAPLNPEYKKRHSSLNLYHLKMVTAERRKARRDLYKALDPNGAYQKIGYDYLDDDSGLALKEVPASRLYQPFYHDEITIRQPDLSAIQPIAEPALPETNSNPPDQERVRDRLKSTSAGPVVSHYVNSPLHRNKGQARNKAHVSKSSRVEVPKSVDLQIIALFAEGAPAEYRIALMRALQRLNLLSDSALHVLLTRLFAERRMELVRSLVDDDSLGFDSVRNFHRARLNALS